jgi:high affinity Mn2+ porin
MNSPVSLIARARRIALIATSKAAALFASLALAAPTTPATAQGRGSPGVPNVEPPEAALFPDLAVLHDRLEDQGWIVRGQATFVLQGHPAFRSPFRSR